MHPFHARAFAPLASALVHVGVLVFALAGASLPELGHGDGPVELGGDSLQVALVEPEPDFGPAVVEVVGIGIVADDLAPVAAVDHAPTPAPARVEKLADPVAVPAPQPAVAQAELSEPRRAFEPAVVAHAKKQGQSIAASKARKPSGKGKVDTCPANPDDGVENVAEGEWRVERGVVDYYAKHLKELTKLGSVRVNKTADGKADGFRVGLAKCSILREGGLRSGDVVKNVNGLVVHDLFSAVGAYLKLRREPIIELEVERKGKRVTMRYELV
ncbi:MAG: hypothetical protein FJ090_04520 [Deltaproteobacteria bacterium]|nr:hypothetical protein [Deltaproteobacteria bacterium]